MIYQHTWSWYTAQRREGQGFGTVSYKKKMDAKPCRAYNLKGMLANKIKATTDDSHLFVILKNQEPSFREFIKTFNLEDYISYEMPYFVTNEVHPYNGRNLKLFLIQSPEHHQRKDL